MAITAAFDLEMRQYDAENAFINGPIDEDTYINCPEAPWILLRASESSVQT